MAAFCVDMTCMRITCTSKDQYGSPKWDYWQCQYVFGLEVDHTDNEVLGDNKCRDRFLGFAGHCYTFGTREVVSATDYRSQ